MFTAMWIGPKCRNPEVSSRHHSPLRPMLGGNRTQSLNNVDRSLSHGLFASTAVRR